jgi:hypothetical protein
VNHRFVVASKSQIFSENPTSDAEASAPKTKGFGTVKKIEKSDEVVEKDDGTKTYESQAKRGVPEYNIFLRPKNGTEGDWVPVGSMVRAWFAIS